MGYDVAPWIFKGRALYQLQLVKSEEARKYIPSEFKLVELFGYTLGGFYLARYDDSPVGAFDELVAMAGLVWNPPTSCAWAARVFVNNKEARDHGLKHVGLPSRLATFREVDSSQQQAGEGGSGRQEASSISNSADEQGGKRSWWRQHRLIQGKQVTFKPGSPLLEISHAQPLARAKVPLPVCTLQLPEARQQGAFAGPRIRMALPSFSGATPDCPELLKYACDLWTNVRPVAPALVLAPSALPVGALPAAGGRGGDDTTAGGEVLTAVLGGRPLLTLAFDDMEMTVQEPERLMLTATATPLTAAAATSSSAGGR